MLTGKLLMAAFILQLILASMWGSPQPNNRKPLITIGKKTTYVMGPVDKRGYVDYVTALNKELSKGITPKNNANVLLWRAMGPHPEGMTMPPEFFKWLGEKPPEKGKYYLQLDGYTYREKLTELQAEKVRHNFDTASQRPWTKKEFPHIAKWLDLNKQSLALVVEASKRKRYYNPIIPRKDKSGERQGLLDTLFPGLAEGREFGNALVIRAMRRIAEKRYPEAWEDLQACHRLGRLLGQGGTIIEPLIGTVFDLFATEGDLVYLRATKLNAKQLKKHLKDIQTLPPFPPLAKSVGICSRFEMLEMIMRLDYLGPAALDRIPDAKIETLAGRVNWDPALRAANDWYDRYVTAMQIPQFATREQKLIRLEQEVQNNLAKTQRTWNIARFMMSPKARGRAFGDILMGLLTPNIRNALHAEDRLRQRLRNLQVAFALEIYRVENGNYPAKLNAVTPNYLKNIPLDFFTGKNLIYRQTKTGYLLYSVGVNGVDERCRVTGDDLVIRIPNSKLRKK